MDEVERLKRELAREQRARQQAEQIAQEKSAELHRAHRQLRQLTDQLEAQAAAHSSSPVGVQECLHAVINNTPIVTFALNREGYFTLSEGKGLQVLGREPGEAVGRSIFVEYRNYPQLLEAVRQALAGEPRHIVVEVRDVVFEAWYEPLRDKDGAVVGVVGVAHDITAPKQAEKELKAQRDFALQIMNTMGQGLTVTDMEGRLEYVNPAFARMVGYEPEALIGKTPYDVTVPEEHHRLRQALDLRTGGEAGTYESRLRRADGSELYVMVTAVPRWHDDQIVGSIAVITDLTERKQAEETHTRLATAIEAVEEAILITDVEGSIQYVNPAFERLTGYTRQEVMGQNPRIFKSGEQDEQFYQEMWTALKEGRSWEETFTNRKKDGTQYHVEQTVAPVRDESGKTVAYVAAQRDMTQRKQVEEMLARARDKALEASRLKSEFLANMSHEIRTPLNGIIGMTGLLLETSLTAEQRDFVNTIRNSGAVLLTVINDILDFSKIEANKLALEKRPFDLYRCVKESLALLRFKAKEKDLQLTHTIDPQTPRMIVADGNRLQQIFLNLVGNAIKFTAEGEVTLSVYSRLLPDERYCFYFAVQDTGIGIAEEHIGHLFRSFSQADASTTRKYGGSGLGLAISKRLAEMMEGTMWVESEWGKGSTFSFTILAEAVPEPAAGALAAAQPPLKDDPPPEGNDEESAFATAASRQQSLSSSQIDAEMGKRHPLRILLAEDNIVNQKVALHLLQKMGYQADVANNGLQVLEALRQHTYDVVLMDIQMPEMDGIQTAAAIRKQWPAAQQPHIIAMTANALQGDREQYLAAGMDNYVSKPVWITELAAALDECRSRIENRKER